MICQTSSALDGRVIPAIWVRLEGQHIIKKEGGNMNSDTQISQEYNDNMNNPETELCFDCRTYKHIDNFTNPEGKHICDQCYSKYEKLCKEKGISFHEVPGRQATSMTGDRYFITDVYGIISDKEYHIGGYQADRKEYNFPSQNKAKIFGKKMVFLHSDGNYICFYCHAGNHNPIDFINKIKSMKDNFGVNYNCGINKYGNYWEFLGNLERVSCAFHFRIFSKKYLDIIVKAVSDPYYKNIIINI